MSAADKRYAEAKIARVGKLAPRPVLFARVILREETNPSVERRAVAEASLDVSGRLVRAQVAARRIREAVDLLEDRLRRALEELAEHYATRRHDAGVSSPAERPDYFPRPAEERQLVRHKALADWAQTPEEAALEMRLLDYDFYLFTNAATGEDNLLYRRFDGALGWAQTTPDADGADGYVIELHTDHTPPARMALAQAVERLDAGGERFVFFRDDESGRGNVLYRRFDGHYGLIVPGG